MENQTIEEEIETVRVSKFGEIGKQITIPIISIFFAFVLGTVILFLMEIDPLKAFEHMTTDIFSDDRKIASALFFATPLVFTGLSVAIAFRAGMFNIGTEGQMVMGGFLSALVGFSLYDYYNIDLPPVLFIPLLLLTGCVGGAAWAFIPAVLKTRGVHEVITTIMMNYVAFELMIFLVGDIDSPFITQEYGGGNIAPQSPQIPESARLPLVFARTFSRLHWGFFIGILTCVVIYIILWKTKLGYEARAVGNNPNAAKYGGIQVNKRIISVMLISGGLGGLAGAIEVTGQFFMYQDKSLVGYGFDGIAVSIIGGNHPIGVIFGALLFGWLQAAGLLLQINQIPKDIGNTLKGFIVFFVAIPLMSRMIIDYFGKYYEDSWLNQEVDSFWSRYHSRKGDISNYFKEEYHIFGKDISKIIYGCLFCLLFIWGLILMLLTILLVDRSIWLLGLADYILSIFFNGLFGSEIGGVVNEIDGLLLAFGSIAIIVYFGIKYRIVQLLRDSFVFFLEVWKFIILLLVLFGGSIVLLVSFKDLPADIGTFFYYLTVDIGNFIQLIFELASPDIDSMIFTLLSTISLVLVFSAYVMSKKKSTNRNIQNSLFFLVIWIGIIEYLALTKEFGQDVTLVGILFLVGAFMIYHEFLANKERIIQWINIRIKTEVILEDRIIIQKYSFFLVIILILFFLMNLVGKRHLPLRFGFPLGFINPQWVLFEIYNYGAVMATIGLIVILFGYVYIRKLSLPSSLRDVHYLPYIFNSASTIFLFFSLAILFKLNSSVSFTVLFGLLFLILAIIISKEWASWKKNTLPAQMSNNGETKIFNSDRIDRFYVVFSAFFLLIAFSISYFDYLPSVNYLPIVIFILLIGVGLIISLYKWLAWKKFPIHNPISEDGKKTDFYSNRSFRLYLTFCSLLILFSILMSTTGKSQLLTEVDIFFFKLENLGSVFGILGLILIVVGYISLRKISVPDKSTEFYYLPIIFRLLSVFFAFQALNTFFSMNPLPLLTMTLIIATPIGLAALGGMFSEKSGVVNIALEGMMLTGAFVAVWISYETHDPWAAVIAATIVGGLLGLIFAIASIKFRANQVVVGVAINILASAVTTLGVVVVWQVQGQSPPVRRLPSITMDFLPSIPIIGPSLYELTNGDIGLSPLVYVFIGMIFVSAWVVQKTSFGLRLRAVGEHPRAADTLGINVYRMRYIAVILSGMLAALGGAQLTVGWTAVFGKDVTTGRGFVALAALIFGGWHPIGAALAAIFFAFTRSFRFQLDTLPPNLKPEWLFFDLHLEKLTPIIPFVITIIAVTIVAKRMRPPAADGIPYVKEGE